MDGSEPAWRLNAGEYRGRLHALEARIARLDLLAHRISSIRMALAIAGIAAIWWSTQSATWTRYTWLVPLTLFVIAVIHHSRVRRARG